MTQELIERLEPCPFCGKHLIEESGTDISYRYWKHPHGECLMRDTVIVDDEDVERAIAAWNTRDQSQSARIAELSLEVARRGMALAPFAEACSSCIDDAPYVPTWCYPNSSPKQCPCGHHEGFHAGAGGPCLNCNCAGLPSNCWTTDEEFSRR